MNTRIALYMAAGVFSAFVVAQPASALTGADVLDRMTAEQRFGYLGGAVEMAAFQISVEGNTDRASCVIRWFYDGGGTDQVAAALERFRDREVMPILQALIERACE